MEGAEKAYPLVDAGWLVRPLIISDVNLKRVLIGGTLCPFDRDMKKLSKTV